MRRFLNNPWHTPLGWILLLAALCVAAGETARGLLEPDAGYYHVLQGRASAPRTAATLTTVVGLPASANRIILMAATTGQWTLESNVTVPENRILWIPFGFKMKINSGVTLTLAACPMIDGPGWLTADNVGKVNITAAGCPIKTHKFSTSGAGTIASPWAGWDAALVWLSGSQYPGSVDWVESHTGREYTFACGNYTQHASIQLPAHYSYVHGPGGVTAGCVNILYRPTGGRDPDGYYTMWTFGTRFVPDTASYPGHPTPSTRGIMSFYCGMEGIQLLSMDDTIDKQQALHIIDERSCTFRNIRINGESNCLGNGYGWCDAVTTTSRGIKLEGREFVRFEEVQVFANLPTFLGGTPAGQSDPGPGAFAIDNNLDHTVIVNSEFLTLPLSNPTTTLDAQLEFDPNVFITNFLVSNASLIGGHTHVHLDTSSQGEFAQAHTSITMEHLRPEGTPLDAAGYYGFIFIAHNGTCVGGHCRSAMLTLRDIMLDTGGRHMGVYLARFTNVLLDSFFFRNEDFGYVPENPNVCLYLGPHAYPVTLLNSHCVASSKIVVAGNQCEYPMSITNGLPTPQHGAALTTYDVDDATLGCPMMADGSNVEVFAPFTPHLIGDETPTVDTTVYEVQRGFWHQIGPLVWINLQVQVKTVGSSGAMHGNLAILFETPPYVSGVNKPPPHPIAMTRMFQHMAVRTINVGLPTVPGCVYNLSQTCGETTTTEHVPVPFGTQLVATMPEGNPNFILSVIGNMQEETFVQYSHLRGETAPGAKDGSIIEITGVYLTGRRDGWYSFHDLP